MKEIATVKKVIKTYLTFGIIGVEDYLNNANVEVFKNSWVSKIKDNLNKKLCASVSMEIEFLITKFKNYDEFDENIEK